MHMSFRLSFAALVAGVTGPVSKIGATGANRTTGATGKHGAAARGRLLSALPALLILALLMTTMLQGCAPRVVPGVPAPADQADAAWHAYRSWAQGNDAEAGPFRLNASLRYKTGEHDGNRVVALLWSNGEVPLRLDIMAGIGATVARIREDDTTFLAYSPNENKAYYHNGDGRALLSFGVPVPFSVPDLAYLLNGRFGRVFDDARADARLVADGGIAYTLPRGRVRGMLELSPEGRPRHWTDTPPGEKQAGWDMRIDYDEAVPPLPRKITITHAKGYSAILLVKERERPQAFTGEQLGLELPEGAEVLPLRQGTRR